MFFKNKNTGLVWEVEGELFERLKNDSNYELVEQNKEEPQPSKKPAKKVGE
jgi:hypothetical protein